MKEHFNAEVEKAIQETRVHALERYTPVNTLEKLLWENKPSDMPKLLFNFQAKCIKEEIPSAFNVVFQCALPGLEQFSIGGRHPSLVLKSHQQEGNYRQGLQEAIGSEEHEKTELSEKDFQDVNIQLQDAEHKLQVLRSDFTAITEQNNSLNRQIQTQTHQLETAVHTNTELDQQLTNATNVLEGFQAKFQVRKELCVALETANKALKEQVECLASQVKEAKANPMSFGKCLIIFVVCVVLWNYMRDECPAHLKTANTDISKAYQTIAELEDKVRRCVMITDPSATPQQEIPDYSTPESRTTFAKFGPYPGLDDELVIVRREPILLDDGVYTGQWNTRNQPHGYGTYSFRSGDIHEGQWRNGTMTGWGRQISADGTLYLGYIANNKPETVGIKIYANGMAEEEYGRMGICMGSAEWCSRKILSLFCVCIQLTTESGITSSFLFSQTESCT